METVPHGITTAVIARFVDIATDSLAAAREEIDALNVYPVPDADTGTNMFLTVSAGREALLETLDREPAVEPAPAMAALSRGMLMGARGNSGVILSQMVRAFGQSLAATADLAAPDERIGSVRRWVEALDAAALAARKAVGAPVEGTMLSVATAAAAATREAAQGESPQIGPVVAAAARAAREALARTPEQLPTLALAGVVDAGGRGLCVVLDAVEQLVTGRRAAKAIHGRGARSIPRVDLVADELTEGGPAYEVMYLLDAADEAIEPLRERLGSLGDSLVVVGGDGLWNVHVHVDDVGAAIEAGVEAGRPHRIAVTHFADQKDHARRRVPPVTGRRVVSVAAGPGLVEVFTEAGAVVVDGGPGRHPSPAEFLEAIRRCEAAEVIVLPNDRVAVRAAEIAAITASGEDQICVEVIATTAQVQGLAALAVHEPGRAFDADVREMTATARQVRHGAVTIAVTQAITMAGPCRPGDVLGVVSGDFAVVGDDAHVVAQEVVARLLAAGGELVTLVAGAGGEGLAETTAAALKARHPHVDVVTYAGGQDRYLLLVGVE